MCRTTQHRGNGAYGLAGTLLILMTMQAVALHSYATLAPFIRDGLRLDAATAMGWRGAVAVTAVTIGVVSVTTARVLARPGRSDGATPVPMPASLDERRQRVAARLLRVLLTPTIYSFGVGLFMSSAMTFLTLFLVDVVALDAVRAAQWFALFGIGGVVGRITWGWLSDRILGGRRSYTLALVAVLSGGAAIAIGLAPGMLTGIVGATLIGVFGFLAQGWVGIVRVLGAELAGPGYSGRAGGLLLGAMMFGGLVGTPIFGRLVELSGDYTIAWIFVGVLAMLSGLVMVPTARLEPARHLGDDNPGEPTHEGDQAR